jgi:drug/metabolite transporter (DMT)-like permease
MTRDRAVLLAVLLLIGAAWGITQPFAKIAVSEGYRHFGIIFWQFALGALLLAAINRARGRRPADGAAAAWRFMSSSR